MFLWYKKWYIMIRKLPEIKQRDIFRPMQKDFIDPSHEWVLLGIERK